MEREEEGGGRRGKEKEEEEEEEAEGRRRGGGRRRDEEEEEDMGDPSGERGVSRPGGQGSKIYVLSSEFKEHESFWKTGDRGDRTEF